MHAPGHFARAARDAGCTIVKRERIDTPFGPVWCAEASCASTEESFRFLIRLAELDVGDPEVRTLALTLHRKAGGDPARFARLVHRWVKDQIWYIREPQETFQSARYTLKTRAGDCDDHAVLVYTLLRNGGLRSQIAPLRKTDPKTGRTWVSHAVAQVWERGAWRWVETTVDAAFGEEPRAAVRRLRLGRQDIG